MGFCCRDTVIFCCHDTNLVQSLCYARKRIYRIVAETNGIDNEPYRCELSQKNDYQQNIGVISMKHAWNAHVLHDCACECTTSRRQAQTQKKKQHAHRNTNAHAQAITIACLHCMYNTHVHKHTRTRDIASIVSLCLNVVDIVVDEIVEYNAVACFCICLLQ